MMYDEYEYEYHDVAEDADYIDHEQDDDDIYYNDGSDEPWLDNEVISWDGYYHNLTEEIED